jgi:hypothetical protein
VQQVVAKYQGYLRSHPELIEVAQRELEGQAPRSGGVSPVGLSEPEVWLDTGEAARHLRISSSSLTKWRCTGKGPRWAKLIGSVVYSLRDLDAWANAQKRRSTAETVTGDHLTTT